MSQQITQTELDYIKQLQQSSQELIFQLGELEVTLAQLEQQKSVLKQQYLQVLEDQNKLAEQLQEKYGEGSIDLSTGEIK